MRACSTTMADVRPVLFERERLCLPGAYLRRSTLDLGIPGLGRAGFRFAVETSQQFERELCPVFSGKAEDFSEHVRGAHGFPA